MRCLQLVSLLTACVVLCSCAQRETLSREENRADRMLQQNRERITQIDMKFVNFRQRMGKIEEAVRGILTEVRQLREEMAKSSLSSAEKKETVVLPDLPDPERQIAPWDGSEQEMAKNIIARLENSTEKTEGNSRWIGKRFPMLRFIDINGSIVELESFKGQRKILLIVLRGFAGGVCLVCSSQTLAISRAMEEFRKRGTEVLVVYPGEVDSIPKFLQAVQNLEGSFEPPFSIVLDADLSLVREFEIEASLAKPSSFIIDEQGIIRYCYIGKHPGDRPSVPVLLQQLDKTE